MSGDPLARLIQSVPAAFFRATLEYTHDAFGEALALTNRHYEMPERVAMLGQNRHARCEPAFRLAAQEAGMSVLTPHTDPIGGRYSVASSGAITVIRGNVQRHCGTPRATKFRRQYATVNRYLSAQQLHLLEQLPPPLSDRMCAMLVVTAHGPRVGDPSVPAFVGLGIPRHDLSSWLRLLSLNELLALYHDADAKAHALREPPVKVKDKAQPMLKRRSPESGT